MKSQNKNREKIKRRATSSPQGAAPPPARVLASEQLALPSLRGEAIAGIQMRLLKIFKARHVLQTSAAVWKPGRESL